MSEYAIGQRQLATNTLLAARNWMIKNSYKDKNLSSLISINLARNYFQQGKFKQAHEQYLTVNKDHSLWVTALIEQGWTQIMLGDPSGAIGNMYSLHSPYFNAVYMPESFAVRTIGYLNICQYGDAYQTLKMMEEKHQSWYYVVNKYTKKYRASKYYYRTLKKYLAGKSIAKVDSLPYQVIREMARRKNFINIQASINHKADEMEQYNFINSYIIRDKSKTRNRMRLAQRRMKNYVVERKKLKQAKGSISKIKNLKTKHSYEGRIMEDQRFKLQVLENSRQGFLTLKKRITKRLAREHYSLRVKAAQALRENLKNIQKEMKNLIANNEFLRYEVFAGSGENIRYLAAGGKTSNKNRLPASIKPKKVLKWSVTGEYWEDEIGNYRSALRNNCPNKNSYGLPPTGFRKKAQAK